MGIYDREYYREEERSVFAGGSRTMVTTLVLVNVAIYLVQLFTRGAGGAGYGAFTEAFSLNADLFREPWKFYQLLTYGFLHDPGSITHILFNMLGLWFFGRELESKYGRREFLLLYLSMIVVGGLAWVAAEQLTPGRAVVLGASAAVAGVVLLFALNFPRRTVLLWFVIPLPAWVLAAMLLLFDIMGAVDREQAGNVAYTCHLGGAAMAFIFYQTGWHFGRLSFGRLTLGPLTRRPKLRVHDPADKEQDESKQVDAVLQKIQEQGQESLTRKERRILQEASRRYQQKHR
ncbi:MAG: rhomboid family intramembrane serine protease [Pirellulales bacterium]